MVAYRDSTRSRTTFQRSSRGGTGTMLSRLRLSERVEAASVESGAMKRLADVGSPARRSTVAGHASICGEGHPEPSSTQWLITNRCLTALASWAKSLAVTIQRTSASAGIPASAPVTMPNTAPTSSNTAPGAAGAHGNNVTTGVRNSSCASGNLTAACSGKRVQRTRASCQGLSRTDGVDRPVVVGVRSTGKADWRCQRSRSTA